MENENKNDLDISQDQPAYTINPDMPDYARGRRKKRRKARRTGKRKPIGAKKIIDETKEYISKRGKRKIRRKKRKSVRKELRKATKSYKRGKITKKELAVKYAKAPAKLKKKLKRRIKFIDTKRKIIGTALFIPLLPLRIVIVTTLKKKGHDTKKMNFSEMVMTFYNEIVAPASKGTFEPVENTEQFYNDCKANHAVGAAIVTAVVSFIKALKKKKAKGEPLTAIEKNIVAKTELVEEKIEEKAKDEAAMTVGKRILFDKKTQKIIIIAVAALVGLLLFKKFLK